MVKPRHLPTITKCLFQVGTACLVMKVGNKCGPFKSQAIIAWVSQVCARVSLVFSGFPSFVSICLCVRVQACIQALQRKENRSPLHWASVWHQSHANRIGVVCWVSIWPLTEKKMCVSVCICESCLYPVSPLPVCVCSFERLCHSSLQMQVLQSPSKR